MTLVLKASAAAISAALIALLLKRSNPELALLLSVMTLIVVSTASLRFLDDIRELLNLAQEFYGVSYRFCQPIVKCLAIAVVTRFSSDLCRDASQAALASGVDFAGGVCALTVALPLIVSVLKNLRSML